MTFPAVALTSWRGEAEEEEEGMREDSLPSREPPIVQHRAGLVL